MMKRYDNARFLNLSKFHMPFLKEILYLLIERGEKQKRTNKRMVL